jgi:hypothetical protein
MAKTDLLCQGCEGEGCRQQVVIRGELVSAVKLQGALAERKVRVKAEIRKVKVILSPPLNNH